MMFILLQQISPDSSLIQMTNDVQPLSAAVASLEFPHCRGPYSLVAGVSACKTGEGETGVDWKLEKDGKL